MTRAALIIGAALTLGLLLFNRRVRCAIRGHHRPERKEGAAGVWCLDCPATGHDLESMGEDVDLPATRRVYNRDRGEVTRTSEWEPETATRRAGRDERFYRPDTRRRSDRSLPLDERFRRADGA